MEYSDIKTNDSSLNGNNIYTPYTSLSWGFALVGIFIAVTIMISIPLALVQNIVSPSLKPVLNLLGYSLSMIVTLLITSLQRKSFQFSWKKVSLVVFIVSIITVIGLGVILEPVVNLIPMPKWIEALFKDMLSKDAYTFGMIVIAAPILEELLFRGLLLEGMLKRYSPWKAVFWSAFIFGVIHMNPWQFIGALSIGMVMGWVYWRTRSLWPCIAMHMVNNLLGYLLMVYQGDTSGFTFEMMRKSNFFMVVYFISFPVFLTGIYLLGKLFGKEGSSTPEGSQNLNAGDHI